MPAAIATSPMPAGARSLRGVVSHSLHRARTARAARRDRGMAGRQPDRVDRHAAPVRRSHRAGGGVPDLPRTQVRVIVPDTGSAYGGKHTGEAAIEAARLARAAGRPVKLVWTRAEEFTWAYFRPAGRHRHQGRRRRRGPLVAWEFDNWNSGGAPASRRPTTSRRPVDRVPPVEAPRCGRARIGRWPRRPTTTRARCTWTRWRAHSAWTRSRSACAHLRDARMRDVLAGPWPRGIGWPKPSTSGRSLGIACGTEKGGTWPPPPRFRGQARASRSSASSWRSSAARSSIRTGSQPGRGRGRAGARRGVVRMIRRGTRATAAAADVLTGRHILAFAPRAAGAPVDARPRRALGLEPRRRCASGDVSTKRSGSARRIRGCCSSTCRSSDSKRLAVDADFLRDLQGLEDSRHGYRASPQWRPTGAETRCRAWRTSAWSSASARRCRSTPAASASWRATTSRPPATSTCRSSASASSGSRATSARCSIAAGASDRALSVQRPGQPPGAAGARRATASWLRMSLQLPGTHAPACAPGGRVGRATLYLLDSNDPFNEPADRGITSALYGGGPEMRLLQEIILGVGGWRLLRGARTRHRDLSSQRGTCGVCRGRTGAPLHGAARQSASRGALGDARRQRVHHAHGRAAGFDTYSYRGARACTASTSTTTCASSACRGPNCSRSDDRIPRRRDEPFNMAWLAVRGSAWVNGVSRLHGDRQPAPVRSAVPALAASREVPVTHVTNGVHVPTWDSPVDRCAVDAGRRQGTLARRRVGAGCRHRSACRTRTSGRCGRANARISCATPASGSCGSCRGMAISTPRARTAREVLRSVGPHARVRAPLRQLQAPQSAAGRSGAAAAPADRPAAAGAAHRRRQGASPRRGRQGADPAVGDVRLEAARSRAHVVFLDDYDMRLADRTRAGRGRVDQHAAPAVGSERHERHEGAGQRRPEPVHARRLVVGSLRSGVSAGPSAIGTTRTATTGPTPSNCTRDSKTTWCRTSTTATPAASRASGSPGCARAWRR